MSAMTVWEFHTASFRVALEIEPETSDPADSFEFAEDVEAVRSGAVEWFSATVAIYLKDGSQETLVGVDHLGACAYKSVREFFTSHRDHDPLSRNCSLMRAARGDNTVICHYFPSMVKEACLAARQTMGEKRQ